MSRILPFLAALALACNSAAPGPVGARSGGEANSGPETSLNLPQIDPDPREKVLAQGIKMLLESEHLKQRAIDDELSRKAFDEYIDVVDPGKIFFLEEHVNTLREAYADRMDDQLESGDLLLARTGAALLAKRQEVVGKTVDELLSKPFDYQRIETLQTDPDKRTWAKSEDELADRWRKSLKLQVLEQVASMAERAELYAESQKKKKNQKKNGKNDSADETKTESEKEAEEALAKAAAKIPKTFEGREKKAREDLQKSYSGRFSRLAKVEPLEPGESFFNAIAAVYDPHTHYLAPAEKDNFDIAMSGSLEGIGAVLQEDDHYIKVAEIVPGGASWRQGELKAEDLILAVAQEGEEPVDVADMRINQVVQMIRGPKGTVVTLTVKKPDDRVVNISITRDVVEIEAAYARGGVLNGKGAPKVGYISLASFYGNTRSIPGQTPQRNSSDDLRKLLSRMEKRGVKGVIIDLRGNGGGLLDHAREITGLFIEKGPVVQTKIPKQDSEVLRDTNPSVEFKGEVLVLVDRHSASASEIVAAALQDYQRAVVVGTGPTHGKGTVQVLLDLSRLRGTPGDPLGVLKLTVQQFYRINGESTQWRGVIPDITLPDPAGHLETRERDLENAIPWDKIESLSYDKWKGSDWQLPELATKSKQRVAENKTFKQVISRSHFLDERRKQTLIPLNREKWEAQRKADREALEAADPELEDAAPRFELELIDYDGAKNNVESKRKETWKKSVIRDPWIAEARNILRDML